MSQSERESSSLAEKSKLTTAVMGIDEADLDQRSLLKITGYNNENGEIASYYRVPRYTPYQ
jgi:hypothetical protein